MGVLFDVIVCYLGRDLKLYEDDDEENNEKCTDPSTDEKFETKPDSNIKAENT